jgi:hypothetical protein
LPPIPERAARLWFYRLYISSETLNMTKVPINGVYAGYAQLDSAFYRDVPAGVYHIDVEILAQIARAEITQSFFDGGN